MTVTFQDGEPVDPKKLQDLQSQIDEIKKDTAKAYSLSQQTAEGLSKIVTYEMKAGVAVFENGLKKGANSIAVPLNWKPEFDLVYIVATPRLQKPWQNNVRWSFSGSRDNTSLNVYAEKEVTGTINFHWVSVAEREV